MWKGLDVNTRCQWKIRKCLCPSMRERLMRMLWFINFLFVVCDVSLHIILCVQIVHVRLSVFPDSLWSASLKQSQTPKTMTLHFVATATLHINLYTCSVILFTGGGSSAAVSIFTFTRSLKSMCAAILPTFCWKVQWCYLAAKQTPACKPVLDNITLLWNVEPAHKKDLICFTTFIYMKHQGGVWVQQLDLLIQIWRMWKCPRTAAVVQPIWNLHIQSSCKLKKQILAPKMYLCWLDRSSYSAWSLVCVSGFIGQQWMRWWSNS